MPFRLSSELDIQGFFYPFGLKISTVTQVEPKQKGKTTLDYLNKHWDCKQGKEWESTYFKDQQRSKGQQGINVKKEEQDQWRFIAGQKQCCNEKSI